MAETKKKSSGGKKTSSSAKTKQPAKSTSKKAPASGAVSQFIDSMLENLLQQEDIDGVIINPWGEQLVLCQADIAQILEMR